MPSKFLAIKKLGALRPIDDTGQEVLGHLGDGEIIEVEFRKKRNVQHHRKFWALMTIVWNNIDHGRYPTVESLVAAIKISTGHREMITLPNGTEVYIPRSISFAKMDQTEFERFYDRMCDVIAEYWLPGVTSQELNTEVSVMIGAI